MLSKSFTCAVGLTVIVIKKGAPSQPFVELGVTVYVNVAGEFVTLDNTCPIILS